MTQMGWLLRVSALSVIGAIIVVSGWIFYDRRSALSAACRIGSPNFSRPAKVEADILGCTILHRRERLEGTVVLDHHGGSLHSAEGGKPIAVRTGDNFDRDPLYKRLQDEANDAFDKYCVSALSIEAEGWLADPPGDRWGDRKFYIDRLIAVGPPAETVVAVAMKAVPADECPKPSGS